MVVAVSPVPAKSPAKHIAFTAHWSSPRDTFMTLPPCDPVTYKSPEGICRGTASGAATNTGGWNGTTKFVYGWVYSPNGVTYVQSIETFTGTVRGCGAGTFTYRLSASIAASGAMTGNITLVPALGTGALKGAHGGATLIGNARPDFSNEGDFRGHLTCQR
jgi:hypothetical protein